MKRTSKLFAAAFLFIGICAALAALGGATHQFAVAALCLVMWMVLMADGRSTPKEVS